MVPAPHNMQRKALAAGGIALSGYVYRWGHHCYPQGLYLSVPVGISPVITYRLVYVRSLQLKIAGDRGDKLTRKHVAISPYNNQAVKPAFIRAPNNNHPALLLYLFIQEWSLKVMSAPIL